MSIEICLLHFIVCELQFATIIFSFDFCVRFFCIMFYIKEWSFSVSYKMFLVYDHSLMWILFFFRVMFYKSSVICMNQWLCDSVEIRSGSSHLNQKKIDWHTKRPVIKKRFELITKKIIPRSKRNKKKSATTTILWTEKKEPKKSTLLSTQTKCVCVFLFGWPEKFVRFKNSICKL